MQRPPESKRTEGWWSFGGKGLFAIGWMLWSFFILMLWSCAGVLTSVWHGQKLHFISSLTIIGSSVSRFKLRLWWFRFFVGSDRFFAVYSRGAGIYSQTIFWSFSLLISWCKIKRIIQPISFFIVGSSGLCLWCFRFLQEPGDFMSVVWGVREFIARPFGKSFSLASNSISDQEDQIAFCFLSLAAAAYVCGVFAFWRSPVISCRWCEGCGNL